MHFLKSFYVVNDAQNTATTHNAQAAEKCSDPSHLQGASENTGKQSFLYVMDDLLIMFFFVVFFVIIQIFNTITSP